MILSIKTTTIGKTVIENYVNENNKTPVSFIDAAILACIGSGVDRKTLEQRIAESYPFQIDWSLILNKLLVMERQKLISIIRSIEDDTMFVVKCNGVNFRCRYIDLVTLNPQLDWSILKDELPYNQVVAVTPELFIEIA